MSSGGGGETRTITTTTNQAPWSAQRSHLKNVFATAEELSNTPLQYYPGQTYVDLAPETQRALQLQAMRALGGSPALNQSQELVTGTAGGDYLGANPYLDAAYDRAASALTRNYREATAPNIDARFSRAGRYGSNQYATVQSQAQDNLARGLEGLAANVYGQDYARERENQLRAAALAPSLAAQDYVDLAQLRATGESRQAQAERALAEEIARFNFGANEPWQRLARYQQMVQGNYGGTSTTTQPILTSSTNDALNVASGIGGIFGTLLGGLGSFGSGFGPAIF
jgi:hypothetical protein